MKIHVDFNSLAEMLNFSRTMGGGFEPPKAKEDTENWKAMYERTAANLERAYERIRMLDPEGDTASKESVSTATPIHDLELSNRTTNALKASQIYTVEMLCKCTFNEIRNGTPGIAKIGAEEIVEALAKRKLKLKC